MTRTSLLQILTLALVPAALSAGNHVGLHPVGSYRLGNPVLQGDAGPQDFDEFAGVLASGDLDGDGFDDLVVGVPRDDGPLSAPLVDSGSVMYYRGGPTGPALLPTRILAQIPGFGLEEGDQHGGALAICDFDADGFDDLAVGAHEETVGAALASGAVFVYRGRAGGPERDGYLLVTQDTAGIPDQVEPSDLFGAALACGDFDGDGFADLAIGAPGESIGAVARAGWIVAIPGSAGGLVPAGSIAFSQLEPLIASEPEVDDAFGWSLAVGDLDADGFDDLAIGSRGEDAFAGCVHVLFGSASDLTAAGSMLITDQGLGGLSEIDDELGRALAIGDFDADGFDDLVIGIPFETFTNAGGPVSRTGQVAVVYGAASLPVPGAVEYWAENNVFAPGTSEENDHFGAALAVGDFDGDGFDDLAVGHPGETIVDEDDGALTIIAGSQTGLGSSRARRFVPSTEGVPGPPQDLASRRAFARSIAAGDFDGDGHTDLAVGAPEESSSQLARVGTATLLFGAIFADGFESGDRRYWSPTSRGEGPPKAAGLARPAINRRSPNRPRVARTCPPSGRAGHGGSGASRRGGRRGGRRCPPSRGDRGGPTASGIPAPRASVPPLPAGRPGSPSTPPRRRRRSSTPRPSARR
jgi:hypothetical protein